MVHSCVVSFPFNKICNAYPWSGFESLILIGSRTWEDHVFEELLAWQLGGVYTLILGIYSIYSRNKKELYKQFRKKIFGEKTKASGILNKSQGAKYSNLIKWTILLYWYLKGSLNCLIYLKCMLWLNSLAQSQAS